MKKLIAVLMVMAIVAGTVFAVSGDKLVLNSTVGEIKPEFKIKDTITNVDGTAAGADVTTDKDISIENIVWTFAVRQEGEYKLGENNAVIDYEYSKYDKPVNVTVTLYPFKATIGSVTYVEATMPTISNATAATVAAADSEKIEIAASTATKTEEINNVNQTLPTVTFAVTYKGQKVDDRPIGTFTGTWTKDPTLPVEGASTLYTADVVLTYTAT